MDMEVTRLKKRFFQKCLFPTKKVCIDLVFVITTVLFISSLSFSGVSGKLTLSKQCGDIVCKVHYYCARVDDSCRPCQETCDTALSNYDQNLCEKDCQDYLHDLMYMRKSLKNQSDYYEDDKIQLVYTDIQVELRTLKLLLMVAIIISTTVMIALLALFMYIKRSRNRLGISNPAWCGGKRDDIIDLPVIYSNSKCITLPRKTPTLESGANMSNSSNNNMSRVSTPDVVSRSEAAVSVLAVNKLPFSESIRKSQKFRREPSESTLPDYQGYDNPALAPSPTHI